MGRQVAQRLLSQPDLLQQPHGVQAHELSRQLLLDRRPHAAVGQEPITRRGRREVNLLHARAVARLELQLESGRKKLMYRCDDAYNFASAIVAAALLRRP